MCRELISPGARLIGIFPRCRTLRRQDKNWSRDKYLELIRRLQQDWPGCQVAIFGEPAGAYFADGVPTGCVDLITVAADHRMDIQVAALQQTVFALGSMSGAVLVGLATGCPTLTWGYAENQSRYDQENFMRTPMIFHAEIDPGVETVLSCARRLMDQAVERFNSRSVAALR